MEPSSTKSQILDAAERLFAEFGLDATSLRAVTSTAGVNLAAVHYHFGSKEGLIQAVFARRLEPLNRERIDRLEVLTASGQPIELTDLLRAMLEPALRMAQEPGGAHFLKLMGRMHSDPDALASAGSVFELFQEFRDRFLPCFQSALPELPQVELFWRLHFVFGAMAGTMTSRATLDFLSDGRCRADDADAVVARLVAFAEAGLRGPLAAPPEAGGRR
jgi:AcrR family transcriptional regulator